MFRSGLEGLFVHILIDIPTKNRAGILARCLAALSTQTYQNFDVLIMDDSDPNQRVEDRPIVQEWISRLRLHHKVWLQPGSGVSQAHNHNVPLYDDGFSEYEWILRLDDDIVLNSRFLEYLIVHNLQIIDFRDRLGAISGLYFENEVSEPFSDRDVPDLETWEEHIELQGKIGDEYHPSNWQQRLYHWARNDLPYKAQALYSACLYNAHAVREVGGWPECFSPGVAHMEETDATFRLHTAGYELLVIPQATAQHLKSPGGIRTEDDWEDKQMLDWQIWAKRLPLILEGKFDELSAMTPDRPLEVKEKIMVLIWSDSPENTSGFGLVTKEGILKGLLEDPGIDVAVLARMDHVPPRDPGYWFLPVGMRDPDGYLALPIVMDTVDPDIVIINYDPGNVHKAIADTALQGSGIREKPIIAYFPMEGFAEDVDGNRVSPSPIFTEMAKMVDMPVTWTRCGADVLIQSAPELAGKIHVVPLGLDHADFHPLPEEQRNHLRKLVGWDDKFIIMETSFQKRIKCQPYLLEAMQILLRKGYDNVALYLHCQPFLGHVMEGWHLGYMVQQMGLDGYVFFPPERRGQYTGVPYTDDEFLEEAMQMVRPPLPQQRGAVMASLPLAARYAMADVYANVSSVEGWNLPIGESMACGTPVIMTDDNFVRREIYGDAAFMIKPKHHDWWHTGAKLWLLDPVDIANAIECLMLKSTLRQKLSIRGLELVKQYEWKDARAFFRKAVRTVLARRPTTNP